MPGKAKFKKIILGWLLVLFISSCGNQTSTQKLLDASFLQSGLRTYQIVAPPNISQGIQFDLILNSLVGNQINVGAKGDLSWSVSMGAGTVTVINAPGFTNGQQRITLRYDNAALAYGSSEVVVLKAADKNDSTQSGSSNAITAIGPATLASFQITAPSNAYVSTDFSITIKAIGSDGGIYSMFTGCVNLAPSALGGTTGVLSVTSVCGFSGGTATTNVNFNQALASLILTATDPVSSKSGNTLINVLLTDLTLIALPIPGSSTIRLNWTSVATASSYNIYKNGVFVTSKPSGTIAYPDSAGLTLGNTYTYRVDVLNASSQVIKQATYSVTYNSCSPLATTININTTLTKAASPYCPAGSVTVSGGTTTLTIQPGTIILFPSGTGMTVSGGATLSSSGTVTDPIIFSSNTTTPAAGDWTGINLNGANPSAMTVNMAGNEAVSEIFNGGSIISNTTIEFAGSAITTNVALWLESDFFRLNKAANGGAVNANFSSNSQWLAVRSSYFLSNSTTSGNGSDINNGSGFGHAVIRAGAFVNSNSGSNGGAIYLNSAQNTLVSSTFTGCVTVFSGGGAMFTGSNQIIKNNTFTNGNAFAGGALRLETGTNLLVSNNTFAGSFANPGGGGGISTAGVSSSTFSGNTFNGTWATTGGGMFTLDSNNVISGNTFLGTGVSASNPNYGGGAIYIAGTGHIVTQNTFTNTYIGAGVDHYGGAIHANSDTTTISLNLFQNTYAGASGAAIGSGGSGGGGAIFVGNNSVTISRNTFDSTFTNINANTSNGWYSNGGAICISGNNATIRLNNFINTSAKGLSSSGGAIFIGSSANNAIVQHNNFSGTTMLPGATQNVFGIALASGSLTIDTGTMAIVSSPANWWGPTAVSGATCSAATPASICVTTGINPTIAPYATAWPLCSGDYTNVDCVGK